MQPEKKKVVVVGGGVGGSLVAKQLELVADVTLIDPKEFFEVPFAGLRVIVEPKFAEQSVFLHKDYLKKAKIVQSSAVSATEKDVVTSDGETIAYDFLVISTGTTFQGATTRAERLKEIDAANKKLVGSKSILIVGGGPVGVELAGEVVTDFPDKKVVIVQSGDRLIDFLGPNASKKAHDWLVSKKVEVILNDRVELEAGSSQVPNSTRNGKAQDVDAHFVAVGKKVGSGWLQQSSFARVVDGEGRLKVQDTLLVEGQKTVFAVGDITNIKELKQGYLAAKHASVVVKNIKTLIKSPATAPTKLAKHKPGPPFGIVTLGRKCVVIQFPFSFLGKAPATFCGKAPAMLKRKDLFVPKVRKDLGVTSS